MGVVSPGKHGAFVLALPRLILLWFPYVGFVVSLSRARAVALRFVNAAKYPVVDYSVVNDSICIPTVYAQKKGSPQRPFEVLMLP